MERSEKEKVYGAILEKAVTMKDLGEISAGILSAMGFLWVGYYLVKDGNLVLGPYSGPPACELIRKGKGVCGTAWAEARTIIVPDVEKFPGVNLSGSWTSTASPWTRLMRWMPFGSARLRDCQKIF